MRGDLDAKRSKIVSTTEIMLIIIHSVELGLIGEGALMKSSIGEMLFVIIWKVIVV